MIEMLMLHRVLPNDLICPDDPYFIRGTLISQERLEQLISSYLHRKFTFVKVSDVEHTRKNRIAVLTFDDGYLDNYLFVKPILEKYNISATFYPIVGYCKDQTLAPLDHYYHYVREYIDSESKSDWIKGEKKKSFLKLTVKEQWRYLKNCLENSSFPQVSYMTLAQIKELHDLNQEIGGHSCYHDIYTLLDQHSLSRDILGTIEILKSIGIDVKSFAYPDGKYNIETIKALKKNGVKCACTIKSINLKGNLNLQLERKFVTENETI